MCAIISPEASVEDVLKQLVADVGWDEVCCILSMLDPNPEHSDMEDTGNPLGKEN